MASPHNTHGAVCSHQVPGKHSHLPRRRVVPYRRERRVFRLSLAALPSDLGKREDILSPSCPRRPTGQDVVCHSAQPLAWESPRGRRACRRLIGRVSGPRARAVALLVCSPALSLEAAASRASSEGVASQNPSSKTREWQLSSPRPAISPIVHQS